MAKELTKLEGIAKDAIKRALEILTQRLIKKQMYVDLLAMLRDALVRFDKYEAGCPQALHEGDCTCTQVSIGQAVTTIKQKANRGK